MQVKSAAIEGNRLCLEFTPDSRHEAGSLVNQFKAGEYSIKRIKKKRSLGANAFAWQLIDKISAVTRIPKEEVYRQALREIGGVSEVIEIKGEPAFKQIKKCWESKGLGWQCIRDYSEKPGYITAILIYGSSVFDSSQMSAFISALLEDARNLGIETLSDRELSLLEDS